MGISATSFATTSDARFKQNVTSLSGNRLRNLLNLRGVSFQWRQDQFPERSFENETMFGFIAQDVERYFPEIVRRSSDGWRRIQSGAFEPLLTEGFRLHDERISRLEEENRALQERLARMEDENLAVHRNTEAHVLIEAALESRIVTLERLVYILVYIHYFP